MSTSYGFTVQAEQAVDTETELKKQIRGLLKFGVTKRAVAEAMDVQESWLGRWLAGPDADVQVRPISVPEADRLAHYLRDFSAFIQETQRSEAPSSVPSRQTPDAAEQSFRPEKKRSNGR